jgi:hypothetical protein
MSSPLAFQTGATTYNTNEVEIEAVEPLPSGSGDSVPVMPSPSAAARVPFEPVGLRQSNSRFPGWVGDQDLSIQLGGEQSSYLWNILLVELQ